MQFKLKGFLKSLRYIFGRKDEDDDEEEEEIRIGGPTDVKHVAHIGWDGPAATPPAWMDEFHGDESGNLEAGKPGGSGSEDQSSTSQQQVSSKGNKQGKRRKVDNTTKKQRSNNNNNNNNEGEVQLQGSKPKKGAGRKKKPKEDQGPDPLTDKRNTSSFED